jgi:site-specific recombinase XerD
MGTQSWTQGQGPLVPFAAEFRNSLLGVGHPPASLKHYLALMGQLNRWLDAEGLGVEKLTPGIAQQFLDDRRAAGQRRVPTLAALAPLLGHLSEQGVLPAETPTEPTPHEELLAGYRHHLVHDRGLAATTVRRYANFATRFLAERARRAGSGTGADGLTSAEVNAYMLEAGTRLVVDSAKREAADLRALLRYLYVAGMLKVDLGAAMPPVATWRGGALVPTMSPADVNRLLVSCDRSTTSGRRDLAVLVLLARLGLRAGEVAALDLGDVDWRAGEIVVSGKARRKDRLPLPVEVGEALAGYLRDGRPSCECRRLILTLYAPSRPIHPSSITNVVYRACRRAGLARVGGHRLRHGLATEMLHQGGDLLEIAQVLRHSDLGTTAAYAKVDRSALRSVSQPWPGAPA